MEKLFQLQAHKTTVRTEMIAGLTTFLAMAYILAVNPSILSETGLNAGSIFTATALSAAVATLLMAVTANLPIALAPGMGLNAFFTYTVVLGMNYSPALALTAVFLEGLLFVLLSFFNVREAIVESIPLNLKKAVAAGIGLFITLIGMKNAGIIVARIDFARYFDYYRYRYSDGYYRSCCRLAKLVCYQLSGAPAFLAF